MSVLAVLDAHPGNGVPTLGTLWWHEVAASLTTTPAAWLEAVEAPGALGVDRAWVLLGWAEVAASVVAQEWDADTLATAAQALALLQDGPLDRRDVWVVAGLLHRAADLTRLDFGAAVSLGCGRAGARGAACSVWLSKAVPSEAVRPLQTATLRVSRAVPERIDSFDRHDAIVKLDGRAIGRLRTGASLEVAVAPGRHQVRVRLRLNPNARSIRVHVPELATVAVVCAKNFRARNAFPPGRYWRLSVVDGED